MLMTEPTSEKSTRGVAWFLLLIGAIFISIAGYRYISIEQFLANGIWTKGTISGQNFQNDPDGYFYTPVVHYQDRLGVARSWISNVASNPPRYQLGDTVDVVYRFTDPTDALIVDFWEIYFVDLALGGVGILFLLIGKVLFTSTPQSQEKTE